jgi:hypothetical protein
VGCSKLNKLQNLGKVTLFNVERTAAEKQNLQNELCKITAKRLNLKGKQM